MIQGSTFYNKNSFIDDVVSNVFFIESAFSISINIGAGNNIPVYTIIS